MPNHASVSLVGHTTAPEMRYTPSGDAILNFSLATTESKKNGDSWDETTTWWRVTLFGKRAESLKINKGSLVYVTGNASMREYEGRNGKGFSLDVRADTVKVLDKREQGESKTAAPVDNGLPFE